MKAKCFKCDKDLNVDDQVVVETLAIVTANDGEDWDYERDSDLAQYHADCTPYK